MFRINYIFICLFLQIVNLSSQSFLNRTVFVTPGITIGYTFDAKINYGVTLDVGLIENTKDLKHKYGVSFYQYFLHTKNHVQRLRAFNVMYQNDYINVKLGRGRAKNPWGYGKRNRCIVHGFAFDASLSFPSTYRPWLGYRLFTFNEANWAWFMQSYNSVYLNYKYDIIPNTPLRKL